MDYLFHTLSVLPCLIGGLVLAIRDERVRLVSRRTVLACVLVQLAWLALLSAFGVTRWSVLFAGVTYAVVCTFIQFFLYRIARGALAFGDVTAMSVMAFLFSPVPVSQWHWLVIWWVVMGGCVSGKIALRKEKQSVAFVPILYVSALITLTAYALTHLA
ncbi:hypothetical protein [Alloscardovia macacae]|uniref:Peptidase A24 n=1 Tax=Alloscardovia macacae TaxID=1160091 RepID=A0A261F1Q1_9BIFI|nr:hypothetical protein [Alloscardovia macacae]OZG53044.1 hypothetical protein ALMA_1346 [Alloscardovia macacae]